MIDMILALVGWGGMVAAPVAIGVLAVSFGSSFRLAGMAAALTFALFAGWNAHSILAQARRAGELERVIRERDAFQVEAQTLSSIIENDRATIRDEVDDAVTRIRRASAEAGVDRGDCLISGDELDGLRDAFGVDDSAGSAR